MCKYKYAGVRSECGDNDFFLPRWQKLTLFSPHKLKNREKEECRTSVRRTWGAPPTPATPLGLLERMKPSICSRRADPMGHGNPDDMVHIQAVSTIKPPKWIQVASDLWRCIRQRRQRPWWVCCTWFERNLRNNLWGDAVLQGNSNKSTSGWLTYMSEIALCYIDDLSNTHTPQIRPSIFQPHPRSKHLGPLPVNPITEKKVTLELDWGVFTHTDSLGSSFSSGKHIMLLYVKYGTQISDRSVDPGAGQASVDTGVSFYLSLIQQKEPSAAFVLDADKLKQSSLLRTDQLQGRCTPNPIRTEQFLVQPGV